MTISISADSLQLAMVEEVTAGVTPATPTWDIWRTTGESVSFEPNTSENQEIGGSGRSSRPDNITGYTIGGDINFPLAKFDALEKAIAGVLAADWGVCPLTGSAGGALEADRVTIGQTQKTYTIEKRFPNPRYTAGGIGGLACIPGGVPGASITLPFTGGPSVGTAILVIDFVMDDNSTYQVVTEVEVGMTNDVLATKVDLNIDNHPALASVDDTAGTLTVTAISGASFTNVTVTFEDGVYQYQRYRGVSFNQMTVDITPNNDITGTFSVLSGTPELAWAEIAGSTYNAAGDSPIFTAPEVLELNLGSLYTVKSHCWTNLTLTYNSNNEGQACIGIKGEAGSRLGKVDVSLSGEIYFLDQYLMSAVLNNQVIGDGNLICKNSRGETYRFDLYQLKPVNAPANAEATEQSVTSAIEIQAGPVKVCDDGGGTDWEASSIISRIGTAPTLP